MSASLVTPPRASIQAVPRKRPSWFGTAQNSFRPQKSHGRGISSVTTNAGQWLENSAQIDVPTPIETAWELWEDRERIPQWMPWITSVVIQDGDASLSKWTLSTNQFNRDWEFSWLAKNMTPLKYQKIHWRSVPGSVSGSLGGGLEIQNQGQIRFSRKNDGSCAVKLTISYEVPGALAPVCQPADAGGGGHPAGGHGAVSGLRRGDDGHGPGRLIVCL